MRWGVVLMVAVCLPVLARADAKSEFDAGIEAYDAGRFREAAQHFSDAYGLDPRPTLLFNQAQAWRRDHESSGDPVTRLRALELYRIFVAQPQISEAQRIEATVHLKALEAGPAKAPSPPQVVPPAAVVVAPLPPAAPPPKRRTGLWVGVGVGLAVVVGALAVGLGVGLTQEGDSPRLTARW